MHDSEGRINVTLCITAFNEQDNLDELVDDLRWLHAQLPETKVVLVDNGSTDATAEVLRLRESELFPWFTFVQLSENLGYGGGLRKAVEVSGSKYVALLSADRQYPIADIMASIASFQGSAHDTGERVISVGNRVIREDPTAAKVVSRIYSMVTRLLITSGHLDINAQPKILSRSIIMDHGVPWSQSFFFDAQIIAVAQYLGNTVVSTPVTFVNRRHGKSSWSGQRIRVYRQTLAEMWRFRKFLKGGGLNQ